MTRLLYVLGPACLALLGLAALHPGRPHGAAPASTDAHLFEADTFAWSAYGGDAGGTRYAPYDQINRQNVGRLRVAWTYRTGELGRDSRIAHKLTFEATPIYFDGALYLSTAYGKIIALDPATGTERWTYDPEIDRTASFSEATSRGVSAWHDAGAAPGAACARRIYLGTIDARLIAVDAATGAPCRDFGDGGTVDLTRGLTLESPGDYQVTSPPAVVRDLVVVGSSIGDNWSADTGNGAVRAFDARTGALRWTWEPIPRTPETEGRIGAANAWTAFAADPERDLVFIPTTSPSPDFYGGLRTASLPYANALVALRASTGEVAWHFQTVHHDLWDYDLAAQPALVTVVRDGRAVPAVAQATKMGHVFLLHRETGAPLHPIEERPVPLSDVPGERAAPTQPFPVAPPPLVPQGPLTPEDAWGPTEEDQAACRDLIANHRSDGIFTPPSLEGTLMIPGNGAGTNWGSTAFDPTRGLLLANASRYATLVRLIPREDAERVRAATPDADTYEWSRQAGTPYVMMRRTLLSPAGLPCNPPPWGTLAAVDLAAGTLRWTVPTGRMEGGIEGLPTAGGPIVTGGGLVFLGGTLREHRFRAYDIETGEEIWSVPLPHAAIATPMTYQIAGRQYVVTVAGGHGKMGEPLGDYVLAYALP